MNRKNRIARLGAVATVALGGLWAGGCESASDSSTMAAMWGMASLLTGDSGDARMLKGLSDISAADARRRTALESED